MLSHMLATREAVRVFFLKLQENVIMKIRLISVGCNCLGHFD